MGGSQAGSLLSLIKTKSAYLTTDRQRDSTLVVLLLGSSISACVRLFHLAVRQLPIITDRPRRLLLHPYYCLAIIVVLRAAVPMSPPTTPLPDCRFHH